MTYSNKTPNPAKHGENILRYGARAEATRVMHQNLKTAGFNPVLAILLGAVFTGFIAEVTKGF